MGESMNNKTPTVSIIIPFYNNVDWLNEAVDSVMKQTYKDYEIIVVNDGSKEDITLFLEKNPEIIYFYQKNNGAGSARNKGIDVARGKYIAFLDSDDVWLPQKLEKQVDYMENNPQIMWSHCSYQTFGYADSVVMSAKNAKGNMYPKCLASCRIATPCVIIKREVFRDKTLRFSQSMRYGQDHYLWVLLCKKYNLGIIDEVLTKVRMRGSNAAKRAFVMLKAKSEMKEQLKKNKVIDWKEVPLLIRSSYELCKLGYLCVSCLSRSIKSQMLIEFVSKVLYIVPYRLLKCEMIRDRQ